MTIAILFLFSLGGALNTDVTGITFSVPFIAAFLVYTWRLKIKIRDRLLLLASFGCIVGGAYLIRTQHSPLIFPVINSLVEIDTANAPKINDEIDCHFNGNEVSVPAKFEQFKVIDVSVGSSGLTRTEDVVLLDINGSVFKINNSLDYLISNGLIRSEDSLTFQSPVTEWISGLMYYPFVPVFGFMAINEFRKLMTDH